MSAKLRGVTSGMLGDVGMCSFIDEEDKDSLQELTTEQRCFVEHILCTKPLPCR